MGSAHPQPAVQGATLGSFAIESSPRLSLLGSVLFEGYLHRLHTECASQASQVAASGPAQLS